MYEILQDIFLFSHPITFPSKRMPDLRQSSVKIAADVWVLIVCIQAYPIEVGWDGDV